MIQVPATLIALVLVSTGANASVVVQEEVHIWRGVMHFGAGASVEVRLTSAAVGDAFRVSIQAADGPESEITDITWDEDILHFRWGAFSCALESNAGGGFDGACEIDDGGTATLSFEQPPELREAADRRSAGVASGGEVLTTAELVESGMLTVYEALEQLRPRWLIPRGPNKYLRRIVVYVYANGQRRGEVEVLRSLKPEDVLEVRYYNASEATQRFGGLNEAGAIELTLRR